MNTTVPDSLSKEKRQSNAVLFVIALFVTALAMALHLPPLPQSLQYHQFADARTIGGIPNFWNVVSNAAFLLSGAAGLLFLLFSGRRAGKNTFLETSEWWPYFLYFVGVLLTGVGSAYYHWQPSNDRLVWDRLPLAIMFMSLFSAVIAERLCTAAGTTLTIPFVFMGIGSVVNWATSERLGAGDLRFYVLVQFFPLLAIPLVIHLCPPRYTEDRRILQAIAWYALAKVAETLDAPIYSVLEISGHTVKHVLCGVSAYWVLRMLQNRQPLTH